ERNSTMNLDHLEVWFVTGSQHLYTRRWRSHRLVISTYNQLLRGAPPPSKILAVSALRASALDAFSANWFKLRVLGGTNQFRLRIFESSRRISRYSHTSVTMIPNAPYHSIYFGAPTATPCSMKSKSSTRFSDAMATTNRLKPIPIALLPLIVVK